MNKCLGLLLSILILNGCNEMSSNNPPNPKKIPYELEAHGDVRIDNYYWMRDDSRSDPQLISYLESENEYFKKWRDSKVDYQNEIYNELKNMIPAEEETLRVKDGNFYYYSRIKANQQYSTFYRNNTTEEILLDANKEAEGKEFYSAAGLNVSPKTFAVSLRATTSSPPATVNGLENAYESNPIHTPPISVVSEIS